MNSNLFTKTKPDRVYLNLVGFKTYVIFKSGQITVHGDNPLVIESITQHLKENGIGLASIDNAASLLTFLKSIPELSNSSSNIKPIWGSFTELENNKTTMELCNETKRQDLSTIKFKFKFNADSRKNAFLRVDHREPLALQTMLYNCQIESTDTSQLALGDILIGSKDGKSELIIERKTADLSQSIMGPQKHGHDQIERYFQHQQEQLAKGIHVKVIWIIENEEKRTVYNSLELAKQVDGWINLQVAISDQYMVTSFNLEHTAYLVTKFAQGFLERKLTYPVKVNGKRIDTAKPHKFRNPETLDTHDRGINRAQASIAATLCGMPNIPSNVAKELASTGKSLREIFAMDLTAILALKGIGEKRGTDISSTFNDIY